MTIKTRPVSYRLGHRFSGRNFALISYPFAISLKPYGCIQLLFFPFFLFHHPSSFPAFVLHEFSPLQRNIYIYILAMERIDDSREDKWALAEGKYYIRDYEHRSMDDGDFIRFLLSLEWSFDNFSFFFCSLFLLLLFLSISSVSTTTRQLKIFFAQRDWIIFERQFSRISFRTWSIGCAYNLEWKWLSVFLWCIFFMRYSRCTISGIHVYHGV